MDQTVVLIAAGAALAGFAQGVSGFAFALVALSVWAWGVDPRLAVVLSVFGSLVGQLVTLPFVWRGFSIKAALPFIVGGLIGVPIGAQLVGAADPNLFKFGLGLFLVAYCPLMLLLRPDIRFRWGGRLADAAIGWIGGVLGGMAAISGPVPTLWTTLRGWSKDEQRGVLQGFNIAMHTATLTVYLLAGTIELGMVGALALTGGTLVPFAILGVLVFKRLTTVGFRRVVLIGLTASGLVLIWGAVVAWV
jgi:uncharacterized membrane protein YfcA